MYAICNNKNAKVEDKKEAINNLIGIRQTIVAALEHHVKTCLSCLNNSQNDNNFISSTKTALDTLIGLCEIHPRTNNFQELTNLREELSEKGRHYLQELNAISPQFYTDTV
jgi:hypothetical protein